MEIMLNEPAERKRSPHKRLTAEQVKQGWLLGDYTTSGYLFHLIGALRKDGWQTPILKRTVAEQIQAHPDWGLTLTDDGPTLVGEQA